MRTLTPESLVKWSARSCAVAVKLLATAIVMLSSAYRAPGNTAAMSKARRKRPGIGTLSGYKLRFLFAAESMQEGFGIAVGLLATFEHQCTRSLESDARVVVVTHTLV